MPKRIPTFRPKQRPGRKEQNAAIDKARADDPIRKQYGTQRWKDLRKIIRARDPYCKRCLAKGRVTPTCTVNHIKKARDFPELFWDENNLEGVCAPCHSGEIQSEEKRANAGSSSSLQG